MLLGPTLVFTTSLHAFKQILSVGGGWVKPERGVRDMR